MLSFMHSFQSEWLKKKRSAASWLVIIGGFFIPTIMMIAQMTNIERLAAHHASPQFWESLFNKCWESMAVFLLPMGVILATSLTTQLEFKNNTWKQVYTTPQKFSTVFFSKLLVILIMMLQFFILFNAGIWFAGIIPSLFFSKVHIPTEPFPIAAFLKANIFFYIDCLPIIALQYLISLRYKNFLAPIGIGLALVIASMFALRWKYGYTIPYTYCSFNYIEILEGKSRLGSGINIHAWAIGYFLIITTVSFILYVTKKEKG